MSIDSQKGKIIPKSRITEILALFFATPAALGVVAKFDDRLDMTDTLERIVLNFKSVTQYIWKVLNNYIPFDFSEYYDFFTFVLLISLPILSRSIALYPQYRKKFHNKDDRNFFIKLFFKKPTLKDFIFSEASGIKYMAIGTFFTVSLIYIFELYILISGMLLLLMGIIVFIVVLFSGTIAPNRFGLLRFGLFKTSYIISVALFLCISLYIFYDKSDFYYSFLISIIITLIAIASFIPLLWIIFVGSRNISYVGFWACGILILNWVAVTGIPAINDFLDKASA